jgi:hypothetical protein
MSNLRQKERHVKSQSEQQTTSRLLEQTNKKLDTLIELFKLQNEQIKNISIQKNIINTAQKTVETLQDQLNKDQPLDFIPTVNTRGMKTNSKAIEVKKRRRDLDDNLKKLQDIKKNGENTNASK